MKLSITVSIIKPLSFSYRNLSSIFEVRYLTSPKRINLTNHSHLLSLNRPILDRPVFSICLTCVAIMQFPHVLTANSRLICGGSSALNSDYLERGLLTLCGDWTHHILESCGVLVSATATTLHTIFQQVYCSCAHGYWNNNSPKLALVLTISVFLESVLKVSFPRSTFWRFSNCSFMSHD